MMKSASPIFSKIGSVKQYPAASLASQGWRSHEARCRRKSVQTARRNSPIGFGDEGYATKATTSAFTDSLVCNSRFCHSLFYDEQAATTKLFVSKGPVSLTGITTSKVLLAKRIKWRPAWPPYGARTLGRPKGKYFQFYF